MTQNDVTHEAFAQHQLPMTTDRRVVGRLTPAIHHPLAITMWDFSWLERRWPGAGYEDWDEALDALKLRGYDAVRIDAYPHLLAVDGHREWTLKPEWSVQDWGSPAINTVRDIQKHLVEFVGKCKERGILVGLSTWFREDVDNHRMNLKTPEDMANIWTVTLDILAEANLLDNILYVDLCNEFSLGCWVPFLAPALGYPLGTEVSRTDPGCARWMEVSLQAVREKYPNLRYCYSITSEYDTLDQQNFSYMDLLEPHIWMATATDFYQQVGYNFERFSMTGYENVVKNAESLYRSNPEHWNSGLKQQIYRIAEWSRREAKPLVTTECWSLVDYKDWPLLPWDYLIELCEIGVRTAAETGRWMAIATSNFCGPQFVGMWRDVAWHQRMTDIIHNAKLPEGSR